MSVLQMKVPGRKQMRGIPKKKEAEERPIVENSKTAHINFIAENLASPLPSAKHQEHRVIALI